MQILVMGGTEFVDKNVAKYLISKGYTVDIFTRGIKSITYTGFRNHFKGDRHSIFDLNKFLSNKKYDYVFDISAYTKKDVQYLISVLNKTSIKRYVFCSSGAVYKPYETFVMENFVRGENVYWGAYGLNKKEAEDYLMNLYEKDYFPITIFRPTYIYGKENNLYREVYFFDRILHKLDIPIPNSTNKTEFIHIDDLVRAFPFRDVTYLLSISKLKNHRLYIPKINLHEGLKKSYEWYCKFNPKIYDSKMCKIDYVLKNI